MSIRDLSYIGMPLNRNSVLRERADWVNEQRQSDRALFLPLYHNSNLIDHSSKHQEPKIVYLRKSALPTELDADQRFIYLGQDEDEGRNTPIFAVDLTGLEESFVQHWLTTTDGNAEFMDLRRFGALIPQAEAAISGYARGLCFWHQNHCFCGRCGNPSVSLRGGHMRKCTASQCGKEVYPRIDPAVIMLVEQKDPSDGIPKCLLGRHKGLPKGIYSTLAGYVDLGESMEEAVAREIMEEAGLTITETTYIASQPWPFPASMMIGFRAKTPETHITVALDELEDAQWFSAEQIRQFAEHTDKNADKALPRKDSIARSLIEGWLQDQH